MKKYYELHVTFLGPFNDSIPGWKYSQIDGDPVLGPGVKAYLTKQHKLVEDETVLRDMLDFAAMELRLRGYEVLRTKIELVVFDSKTFDI